MIIPTLHEDDREDEWQTPVSMAEEDMETDTESDMDAAPPVHPVPTMQGAFEESMNETMYDDESEVPDRYSKADSVARRKMLLEQNEYERTVAGRWKQKPGEKFHPLWKLVAQISFGMHLLQQGLAKSDEEVLKILQTHVDEVDGFLERTTEDFDLAQGDINERIRYLKLPLEHGQVFDQMLSNRDFRVAIVEGNEKIEHIIDRTAAAMNDALKDVQKGLDATRELAKYMTRVDKRWNDRTEEHDSVYLAMIGNTEGWTRAFLTLQSKGGHLRKALVQLGSIVAEMQRRAGAASRKNLVPSRPLNGNRYQVEARADSPQHSATPPRSPMKGLPQAPEPIARVASSQKYIKTSISKSPQPSPRLRDNSVEQGSLSTKAESLQKVSNSKETRSLQSPEPQKSGRTQDSSLSNKSSQNLRNVKASKQARSIASPEVGKLTAIPETARRVRSPEPGLDSNSPDMPSFSQASNSIQISRVSRDGQEYQDLPPTAGDCHSDESKIGEGSAQILNQLVTIRTPAQVMAQMNSQPKPPIPERAPSRRKSLTEKTRQLLRKKPSVTREINENNPSTGYLPIQSPSAEQFSANISASPVHNTTVKSSPSRQANTLSMSTYSTSPISPTNVTLETPPVRETSPVYTRDGKAVPAPNEYNTFALEPLRPMSPLEDPTVASNSMKQGQPLESPAKCTIKPASIIKNRALPDNSEGNVNTNHPLLQTARHTRFARAANGDLPLRHYHSQAAFAHSNPDLTHRQADDMIPPKRSSSLLYDPNRRFMSSPEPRAPDTLSSNHLSRDHPTISFINRAHTAPAESELGIHPAHRLAEPASATTAVSPAPPSTNSSVTEHGATPPPIATARSPSSNKAISRAKSPLMSPPARFAPFPPSHVQKQSQVKEEAIKEHDWQPKHQPTNSVDSSEGPPASENPKYKTTATNNAPFYLNPASSSALIDFLKTTPPPSPPHPGTKVDVPSISPSPSHSATGAFFNRSFITNPYPKDGEPSPPPPAPGSRSLTHLGHEPADDKGAEQYNKKGWKRMFSSSKSTKRANGAKPVNGSKKNRKIELGEAKLNGAGTLNGMGSPGENGFMGMGKDGVWISRKNFLKT